MKLSRADKEEGGMHVSKSFPTGGVNCLHRCIEGNGSSDTLSSVGYRSPKLGRYRKIQNYSDCDVCHVTNEDLTNLKCLHTFCSKCISTNEINKNGCPVCNNLCSGRGNRLCPKSSNRFPGFDLGSEKYSPEKEMVAPPLMTLCLLEMDGYDVPLENTLAKLEGHVLREVETRYDSIKEELQTIEADAESEINKIREHVDNVKLLLDRKSEAMIKNIRESKVRHCGELQRQEKFFQATLEKVKKLIKQCRNIVDRPLPEHDTAFR